MINYTHAELVAAVAVAQGSDLAPTWVSSETAGGWNSAKDAQLDTLAAILDLHTPRNDGSPYSLVQHDYCSCGANEVRMMEDGHNAIVPAEWPCPTVDIVADALRKMGAIE